MWILLDEWSSVPTELQPYLADFLRRCILPVPGVTVKIAAIEQRTQFQVRLSDNSYIGIELGADIAADINLDDFMVFDNDAARARGFFQELIFRHYQSTDEEERLIDSPTTSEQLVREGFTQSAVFDEFVRASEGVPRDGINLLALAAQRSMDNRITMNDIRIAAKNWYQRDKEASVRSNTVASDLLHWIIDEVIGHRRARGFLLHSSQRHQLIDYLFDARVLHILKRNISARDQPGVRYDAYKLDYGCYVDLANTTKAPQMLLFDPADEETFLSSDIVEVPLDDYRSIRRAILTIEEFEQAKIKSIQQEQQMQEYISGK